MNELCRCGSQKDKNNCCIPIINGELEADTALALMRSRYTAFTLADIHYLMRSHHSKTRPIKDRKAIEQWAKSVQWVGLTILNYNQGTTNDSIGYVEFRALYIEDRKLQEIHEKSKFEHENGKWVYVSGVHLL